MTGSSLNILIVDDSIVYRNILTEVTNGIADVKIIGRARNGKDALIYLNDCRNIELVLLDVEMPEMDGLETLKVIRQKYAHVGVIMVSSASLHNADITIQALEAGALDFVQKPDKGSAHANILELRTRLGVLFKIFCQGRSAALHSSSETTRTAASETALKRSSFSEKPETSSVAFTPAPIKSSELSTAEILPPTEQPLLSSLKSSVSNVIHSGKFVGRIDAVAIGISTGGPNALNILIPQLPANIGVPVFIVQHMPPLFTTSLANSLNKKSPLTIKEAENGEIALPDTVYIAPGGLHMSLRKDGMRSNQAIITLIDTPPENSCRPSVDVLFRSLPITYANNILAVIMTGMGQDGLAGVQALKQTTRCLCLTQSQGSCIVYGMPKAVDYAGLSDAQIPLDNLAENIVMLLKKQNSYSISKPSGVPAR